MRVSGCKNVTVQCCSILDWNPSEKYDLIISTLPFKMHFLIHCLHKILRTFERVFFHKTPPLGYCDNVATLPVLRPVLCPVCCRTFCA